MEPLRVLACPDALKGSLTAPEAAAAIADGVRDAEPAADVRQLPLADGGEGTAAALVRATNGHEVAVTVTGPHGRPVTASYGVLGDGRTAVVEAAAAAGLLLLGEDERDPRRATSEGVGQLIGQALADGFRRIILCLGGSGTNDGGIGLLTGLGGRIAAADGSALSGGGAALAQAARLDTAALPAALFESELIVATDVDNPLLGPTGATALYGPQKGADAAMVAELEAGMTNWARLLAAACGRDVAAVPGAGAAGGMAAPLLALGCARLTPGFELVATVTGLAAAVADADLIITGEGRLDGQTLHGKVVHGVAALARQHGRPVIALAGAIAPGAEALHDHGVTAMLALPQGPAALPDLVAAAGPLLRNAASQAVRLFHAGRRSRRAGTRPS